jgi:cob(I)alamin adenosyltransferase
MYKEPKPMKEIHEIQERLFDKEKDLSSHERIRKLREEAAKIMKKYGLKTKTSAKP